MKTFLTLNKGGFLASLLVGIWILVFGQDKGPFFVLVILMFLLSGALVTSVGARTKKKMRLYEGSRGWKNVIANGIIPMLGAATYFVARSLGFSTSLVVAAYVASVAAVTADKFASELGVLDGNPKMLFTLRKVKPGTSGAISAFGLWDGFVGAFIIGLPLFAVGYSFRIVLIVAMLGFVGNLIDSVFGYFETTGIGNKYSSNAMCSLGAWLLCLAFVAA